MDRDDDDSVLLLFAPTGVVDSGLCNVPWPLSDEGDRLCADTRWEEEDWPTFLMKRGEEVEVRRWWWLGRVL